MLVCISEDINAEQLYVLNISVSDTTVLLAHLNIFTKGHPHCLQPLNEVDNLAINHTLTMSAGHFVHAKSGIDISYKFISLQTDNDLSFDLHLIDPEPQFMYTFPRVAS